MDTFNTKKEKSFSNYQAEDSNKNIINKKTNDSNSPKLDEYQGKTVRTLVPEVDNSYSYNYIYSTKQNLIKDQLWPVFYVSAYEAIFKIVEKYLPFINFQTSFVKTGNEDFTAGVEIEIDEWIAGFKVMGDSDLVWFGGYYPTAVFGSTDSSFGNILSHQSYLDSGRIPTSHTTKAYFITAEWTETNQANFRFRINNGVFLGFDSQAYNTSPSPCPDIFVFGQGWVPAPPNNYRLKGLYYCNPGATIDYPGEITGVSGSNLTLKGVEIHTYYTHDGGVCNIHTDKTYGVSKSFNIISDNLSISMFGKVYQSYNNGPWVQQGTEGRNYIWLLRNVATFTNIDIHYGNHYFPYWDTNKRFLFSITNYYHVPQTSVQPIKTDLHNLPYTEIQYISNPDDYPMKKSDIDGHPTKMLITNTATNSMAPLWIRQSKSTDKQEKWLCSQGFGAMLKLPADKENIYNYTRDTYKYIHNPAHTAYIAGTDTHEPLTRTTYSVDPQKVPEVVANVKASIRSLLYWKKTEKLNKETS